jgi:hypothetical protein
MMKDALESEGVGTAPSCGDGERRGDGGGDKGKGKKRKNPTEFQAKFHVIMQDEILIAGRVGIVREVRIWEVVPTPGEGTLLIADVGLSVAVQQMLSIKVAALCVRKHERSAYAKAEWQKVAQTVVSKSVRLIAGEFEETIFVFTQALRKYATARACALEPYIESGSVKHWLGSAAMLCIGPVDKVKTAEASSITDWPSMKVRHRGDTDTHGSGEPRGGGYPIFPPTAAVWEKLRSCLVDRKEHASYDEARGWPIIGSIKQKKPDEVMPHTTKLLIYMGGNRSRRSNESLKLRSKKQAERYRCKPWKPWADTAAQRKDSR